MIYRHMLKCETMPENRRAGGLAVALFLAGCATGSTPVPPAWESVPAAASASDYCSHFECAVNGRPANIRLWENQLFKSTKPLTPKFEAIDSDPRRIIRLRLHSPDNKPRGD